MSGARSSSTREVESRGRSWFSRGGAFQELYQSAHGRQYLMRALLSPDQRFQFGVDAAGGRANVGSSENRGSSMQLVECNERQRQ